MTHISPGETVVPGTAQSDAQSGLTGLRCARRQLLLGAGVGGVVLVAAACGSSSGTSDAAVTPSTGSTGPATTAPGGGAATSSGASTEGIIALSDVPTDAAVSVKDGDKTLLITQSGGTLAAFDATCPHQGCTVAPKDAILQCPCHGSEFSLAGAVTSGPAQTGLTAVAVKVESDQIVLA